MNKRLNTEGEPDVHIFNWLVTRWRSNEYGSDSGLPFEELVGDALVALVEQAKRSADAHERMADATVRIANAVVGEFGPGSWEELYPSQS